MELSVGNHLLHTSFLRFPRSFIIICLLSISYYLCTSKAQTKSGNSFNNHCQTAHYNCILGVCIRLLFGIAQFLFEIKQYIFEKFLRLNINPMLIGNDWYSCDTIPAWNRLYLELQYYSNCLGIRSFYDLDSPQNQIFLVPLVQYSKHL